MKCITCWANSLVGAKIKAWHSLRPVSIFCKIAMENVAVFPVPDCACAITSRPETSYTKEKVIHTRSIQYSKLLVNTKFRVISKDKVCLIHVKNQFSVNL